MTNAQILKKSIEKAFKNGLKLINEQITRIDTDDIDKTYIHFYDEVGHQSDMFTFNTWKLIFSHGFAKAFFGEFPNHRVIIWNEEGKIDNNVWSMIKPYIKESKLSNWQYYLQEMIISENPIKYLEQFL